MQDLRPGATGYLGTASGVTDDGDLFALVRFESEEAARANSDRPEQGKWWAEFEKSLDGQLFVQDSSNVSVDSRDDFHSAGFVQIMTGQSSDPLRSRQLMADTRSARIAQRPDVLGQVVVEHGDGKFTMAIYFTSEAEAREGENKALPAELQAQMQETMSLSIGQPEFLDLRDPWRDSPK